MKYDSRFFIGDREIAPDCPTYFIADIGANHDGDLERAKDLIHKCAEAGADAVKFQHFLAPKIVSGVGFRQLGGQMAHQAAWAKPVEEVYADASLNRGWTEELLATAKAAGTVWMTTPYDREATESLAPLMPAIKIGSGDITWTDSIGHIASQGRPVLLATGAADMDDTERAVNAILSHTRQICLMQCNTNYTGSDDNFAHVNLNVLRAFAVKWPGMVLGLSDHTPGHTTVLGAVTLGARVVEKHFTDDNSRTGPDHGFAMTPETWRNMVDATRELESALGDGVKRVEPNEHDSIIVQRRCLRAVQDLSAGHILTQNDLEPLRPAPADGFPPYRLADLIGKRLDRDLPQGQHITEADLA